MSLYHDVRRRSKSLANPNVYYSARTVLPYVVRKICDSKGVILGSLSWISGVGIALSRTNWSCEEFVRETRIKTTVG